MIYEERSIQVAGSLVDTKATFYLLDTPGDKIQIQERPIIIICPGGGYELISYREGEPLATHFLNQGYHACVLQYSIVPAHFPTQIWEVAETINVICERASEWKIDTSKIFLHGSSAGGHLAASCGAFWDWDFVKAQRRFQNVRLAGLLLSYPVITSEDGYAHRGSFENLLGERFDEGREMLSLEKQVTEAMPPCFLWHTATDKSVPVENSLLMAMALKKAGVSVELHIFPEGEHGLSLANEQVRRLDGSGVQEQCKNWIYLADIWLSKQCEL